MTRKDYISLAEVIASSLTVPNVEAREQLTDEEKTRNKQSISIAYALADTLAEENPNFDRSRFLRSCGVFL